MSQQNDKVKIQREGSEIPAEPEDASQPERAWLEGTELHFNIHEYSKEWYKRIDRHDMLELEWISHAVIHMGKRGGFHQLDIVMPTLETTYEISKTHNDLAREIVKLLSECNIRVVKRVS